LQCTPARGDDVNKYFIKAMIERTINISKEIKQHLSRWEEIKAEKEKADNYYNTGESVKCLLLIDLLMFLDCHFNHPLQCLNPITLIVMFTAVILNVMANVRQLPCNFVLRMMKQLLQLTLNDSSWKDIPQDIRTTCKKFDLDPVMTTFATCLACSSLYAPTEVNGKQTYAVQCTFKHFPTSRPCNA